MYSLLPLHRSLHHPSRSLFSPIPQSLLKATLALLRAARVAAGGFSCLALSPIFARLLLFGGSCSLQYVAVCRAGEVWAFPSYLAFRRFRTTKACINHVLRAPWYLFRDASAPGRAGPRENPHADPRAARAQATWQAPPAARSMGGAKQDLKMPFVQ